MREKHRLLVAGEVGYPLRSDLNFGGKQTKPKRTLPTTREVRPSVVRLRSKKNLPGVALFKDLSACSLEGVEEETAKMAARKGSSSKVKREASCLSSKLDSHAAALSLSVAWDGAADEVGTSLSAPPEDAC